MKTGGTATRSTLSRKASVPGFRTPSVAPPDPQRFGSFTGRGTQLRRTNSATSVGAQQRSSSVARLSPPGSATGPCSSPKTPPPRQGTVVRQRSVGTLGSSPTAPSTTGSQKTWGGGLRRPAPFSETERRERSRLAHDAERIAPPRAERAGSRTAPRATSSTRPRPQTATATAVRQASGGARRAGPKPGSRPTGAVPVVGTGRPTLSSPVVEHAQSRSRMLSRTPSPSPAPSSATGHQVMASPSSTDIDSSPYGIPEGLSRNATCIVRTHVDEMEARDVARGRPRPPTDFQRVASHTELPPTGGLKSRREELRFHSNIFEDIIRHDEQFGIMLRRVKTVYDSILNQAMAELHLECPGRQADVSEARWRSLYAEQGSVPRRRLEAQSVPHSPLIPQSCDRPRAVNDVERENRDLRRLAEQLRLELDACQSQAQDSPTPSRSSVAVPVERSALPRMMPTETRFAYDAAPSVEPTLVDPTIRASISTETTVQTSRSVESAQLPQRVCKTRVLRPTSVPPLDLTGLNSVDSDEEATSNSHGNDQSEPSDDGDSRGWRFSPAEIGLDTLQKPSWKSCLPGTVPGGSSSASTRDGSTPSCNAGVVS